MGGLFSAAAKRPPRPTPGGGPAPLKRLNIVNNGEVSSAWIEVHADTDVRPVVKLADSSLGPYKPMRDTPQPVGTFTTMNDDAVAIGGTTGGVVVYLFDSGDYGSESFHRVHITKLPATIVVAEVGVSRRNGGGGPPCRLSYIETLDSYDGVSRLPSFTRWIMFGLVAAFVVGVLLFAAYRAFRPANAVPDELGYDAGEPGGYGPDAMGYDPAGAMGYDPGYGPGYDPGYEGPAEWL